MTSNTLNMVRHSSLFANFRQNLKLALRGTSRFGPDENRTEFYIAHTPNTLNMFRPFSLFAKFRQNLKLALRDIFRFSDSLRKGAESFAKRHVVFVHNHTQAICQ